jgi:hypothetical protein
MCENSNNQSSKKISYIILCLLIAIGVGLGVGIGTRNIFVGLALGVGVGIGALFLVVLIYGDGSQYHSPKETKYMTLGQIYGMILGSGLGVLLWIMLDHFVFWIIGVGGGMSIGIAIGAALDQRNKQDNA